jgi:TetR/AcrR family transcriptional regulator
MMGEAISTGMADGTIRKGLDPTVVAIFLASASDTIVSLGPNFVATLESQGISHKQYIENSMELLQYFIATQASTKRSD